MGNAWRLGQTVSSIVKWLRKFPTMPCHIAPKLHRKGRPLVQVLMRGERLTIVCFLPLQIFLRRLCFGYAALRARDTETPPMPICRMQRDAISTTGLWAGYVVTAGAPNAVSREGG